jgi:hypothetical protein
MAFCPRRVFMRLLRDTRWTPLDRIWPHLINKGPEVLLLPVRPAGGTAEDDRETGAVDCSARESGRSPGCRRVCAAGRQDRHTFAAFFRHSSDTARLGSEMYPRVARDGHSRVRATSTANGTPVHQRGAGHADALATGPCLDGGSLCVSREALLVLGCAQVGDGDAGIAEGRVLAQRCSGVAGLIASRPDPRAPDRGAPLRGIPEWTRSPPSFT